MGWVAYADESMRMDAGSAMYVLAAAVLDENVVDDVRRTAVNLAVSGPRFHWRHESSAVQHRAVDTVARLPTLCLVVIGTPLNLRRQERGRRKCMERLLFELDAAEVRSVWLESRNRLLNSRDLQLVNVLRIRGAIGPTIRIEHGLPLDEPLLWLGDLVAGAFSSADTQHRTTLEPALLSDVCYVDLG